jgi:hypothetical protein
MSNRRLPWIAVVALLVATCAPGRDKDSGEDPTLDGGSSETIACSMRGAIKCDGANVLTCDGKAYGSKTACAAPRSCIDAVGCVECRPDVPVCVGDSIHECGVDGTIGAQTAVCPEGQCKGGQCADNCGGAAADLIYVVDSSYRLLSFDPRGIAFKLIGRLNCPAGNSLPGWGDTGAATPFSMSVDRDARAWVLYTSGEIFWVSTKDASCMKSPYKVAQNGFELFGMGFVSESRGSAKEFLHIAGGPAGMVENGNLGQVDPATLTVNPTGRLPSNEYGPELTGTGAGELYGYFPGTLSSSVKKIDKTNAQSLQQWPLQRLNGIARAWAFAHWGGRFYIFITTLDEFTGNEVSQVKLLEPITGKESIVLDNIPYIIVGAGVSTCAPIVIG